MKKNVLLGVAVLLLCAITAKAQTVVLQVDMTYATVGQVTSTEVFDPATDVMDVAGSFNGWGETLTTLTRVGESNVYEVALDLDSANHVVAYKFRINESWDPGMHDEISDRMFTVREGSDYADTVLSVFNDVKEGHEHMTFIVDMSKEIEAGNFDPETEFLDVAGTFNNWGGYNELFAVGIEGVYSGYVLAPIGDIEWKTRINADWDNSESIDNRKYTVEADSDNKAEYVYNVPLAPVGVDEDVLTEVSAFPNPFVNSMSVTNLEDVDQIMITNVIGQNVIILDVANKTEVQISTSALETGIYFVVLTNNAGQTKALRVVKQ